MFDHPIPRVFQNRFSTQYRCFSVSMLAGPNDRSDVEKGGKSMCCFILNRNPSRPSLQGPSPQQPSSACEQELVTVMVSRPRTAKRWGEGPVVITFTAEGRVVLSDNFQPASLL